MLIHICNIAEQAGAETWPITGRWQFRNHVALPWCEEYGSLLDPGGFRAHVKLWLSAGKTVVRSRPVDAANAAYKIAFETPKPMTLRDTTPLAFITGPEVYTRDEAEMYMRQQDAEWWTNAARLGAQLASLMKNHK